MSTKDQEQNRNMQIEYIDWLMDRNDEMEYEMFEWDRRKSMLSNEELLLMLLLSKRTWIELIEENEKIKYEYLKREILNNQS